MPRYDDFFAFARERHAIYLRRAAGLPRPWTEDPILRTYKFTNVYRELDRTTAWFKANVREPLRSRPEVLLATVIFRWLNRISTGEAIFCQTSLGPLGRIPEGATASTAFEMFLASGDASVMERAIRAYCGDGPYVTGAYMIKSPTGMDKLPGMMECIRRFCGGDWRRVAEELLAPHPLTLENTWAWLKTHEFQGPFHAYEVVSDLRHTALLDRAPDIMTWANPGPGAQRGLARIHERRNANPRKAKHVWKPNIPRDQLIGEMQDLHRRALVTWPDRAQDFLRSGSEADAAALAAYRGNRAGLMPSAKVPRWEMREVEHTLCEFDKYERVRTGEGRPRGRFE